MTARVESYVLLDAIASAVDMHNYSTNNHLKSLSLDSSLLRNITETVTSDPPRGEGGLTQRRDRRRTISKGTRS